ncbi:RING-H2 finger protein ATL63 [Rhodamnia argentea]|uniref:RING-type E3 ubiquitin transferase n=1 Tax=Rhodamnia argentea TaxID=178133 RepID=A0A8B8NNV0_9MYRT|nr:RING-H2 finger protein ATL63 [Rhodamnia argentea]
MVSLSSPSTPDPSAAARRGRSHIADTISSYDGNVMLAAIISLLLVILFVLLLHFYAKCFLSSSSPRRRILPPPSSAALSARLQTLTRDTALLSPSPASRGLDPSTISSIPLFVARPGGGGGGKDEECVVCLGGFEENDVGRRLPECGHGFHVDCIDTWLRSRASCPVCREPVVASMRDEAKNKNKLAVAEDANSDDSAQESRDPTVQEETDPSSTETVIDILPDGGDGDAGSPSSPPPARAQQSTTSLGCSLKRMLSRSRAESKIHPSSASSPSSVNINEPESNASC